MAGSSSSQAARGKRVTAATSAGKRAEKESTTHAGRKPRGVTKGPRKGNIENAGPTDNGTSPPATGAQQAAAHNTGSHGSRNIQDISNAEAPDVAALMAQLAEAHASNKKLEEALAKAGDVSKDTDSPSSNSKGLIPRPEGTAGHDFSIQEAMRLSGSDKKHQKYLALTRFVKTVTMQSSINWEKSWTKIPPKDKADLFDVCRNAQPILGRYANDWATEEIVKQYLKNKRTYAYKKGYIKRPAGYEHLKANASKRSDAPRGRGRKQPANIEDGDNRDHSEDELNQEDEEFGGGEERDGNEGESGDDVE